MTVYFENTHGNLRVIGVTDSEGDVLRIISNFCSARNYKIPYIRSWHVELDSEPAAKFDVGSHTEFFYVAPITEKEMQQ
jgi:hypothetical protein